MRVKKVQFVKAVFVGGTTRPSLDCSRHECKDLEMTIEGEPPFLHITDKHSLRKGLVISVPMTNIISLEFGETKEVTKPDIQYLGLADAKPKRGRPAKVHPIQMA